MYDVKRFRKAWHIHIIILIKLEDIWTRKQTLMSIKNHLRFITISLRSWHPSTCLSNYLILPIHNYICVHSKRHNTIMYATVHKFIQSIYDWLWIIVFLTCYNIRVSHIVLRHNFLVALNLYHIDLSKIRNQMMIFESSDSYYNKK